MEKPTISQPAAKVMKMKLSPARQWMFDRWGVHEVQESMPVEQMKTMHKELRAEIAAAQRRNSSLPKDHPENARVRELMKIQSLLSKWLSEDDTSSQDSNDRSNQGTVRFGDVKRYMEKTGKTTLTREESEELAKGVARKSFWPERPGIPEMPPAWQEDSVKNFLHAVGRDLVPMNSIMRDPDDPRYKAGKTTNFTSNVLSWSFAQRDVAMIERLMMTPREHFDQAVFDRLRAGLQVAYGWMMFNGPSSGLLERLVAGKKRPKPLAPPYSPAEISRILAEGMPINKEQLMDLKGKGMDTALSADEGWVRISLDSSSGLPWCRPKREVLTEMSAAAGRVFAAIAKGKAEFDALQREKPNWFVALLGNKMDKYEMADFGKKVRPYYKYPGALTLVFSALNQVFTVAMPTFLEHPTSVNAHGFSWVHGGGQRLYHWLLTASKKPPGLYAFAYSDDHLWLVVCQDGKSYMLWPDIKMMDMCLAMWVGQAAAKHYRDSAGDKLDNAWRSVNALMWAYLFQVIVIVMYALAYVSKNQVHSGGVGTADGDQVASTVMIHWCKQRIGAPKNLADLEATLLLMWPNLFKHLGLEVKDDVSRTPHEFVPDAKEYPFVFLGQQLVLLGKEYVPRMPYHKAVVSMILPKRLVPGAKGVRQRMDRLKGIAVTSLWQWPELYYAARNEFLAMVSQGYRPITCDEEDEEVDPTTYSPTGMGGIQIPGKKLEFPSVEQIRDLFLTVPMGVQAPVAGVAETRFVTVEEALALTNEPWTEGDAWGDAPITASSLAGPRPKEDQPMPTEPRKLLPPTEAPVPKEVMGRAQETLEHKLRRLENMRRADLKKLLGQSRAAIWKLAASLPAKKGRVGRRDLAAAWVTAETEQDRYRAGDDEQGRYSVDPQEWYEDAIRDLAAYYEEQDEAEAYDHDAEEYVEGEEQWDEDPEPFRSEEESRRPSKHDPRA